VHVLSYDGNLIDTSCVAVIAALQHFRKPDVSIEGETVTVYTAAEREPVPLSLLHYPFCVTFSYYDVGGKDVLLLDATLKEEQLRDSSVTISLNKHGEVCQIAKLGGKPMDAVSLLQCTTLASVEARRISDLVTSRIKEDAARRKKGGFLDELIAENPR
jgi:exosome complex component RRP45